MRPNGPSEMIGLAEAAQRLSLPYQDAHRLLLTGELRGEKRRNRWYIVLEDVDRLLEVRERASNQADRT